MDGRRGAGSPDGGAKKGEFRHEEMVPGSLLALALAVPALAARHVGGREHRDRQRAASASDGIASNRAWCEVPNKRYVVDDNYDLPYDMFRYGVYWYVYNDNYWYRAHTYRGPFAVVETRHVPREISPAGPALEASSAMGTSGTGKEALGGA
jgi:hypothetical protein